jgi:hypothetical protein
MRLEKGSKTCLLEEGVGFAFRDARDIAMIKVPSTYETDYAS